MQPLRVLIVEDREIVAAKVARVLADAGHEIVDRIGTLEGALSRLHALVDGIDVAVLDVDLRGKRGYPIADLLQTMDLPFIFLTGYGASSIEPEWRHVQRVEKPFESAALLRALDEAMRGLPQTGKTTYVVRTPGARLAMDIIRETRDAITEARARREIAPGPGNDF